MKNILIYSLLLVSTMLSAQKPKENKYVIANAETIILYRHYDNTVSYSSDAKMDSVWIECDSAIITHRFDNCAQVEIRSEKIRKIEITLKGRKRKKEYELGKQLFQIVTIPVPTLFLGPYTINNDFNNYSDEIFIEDRLFLRFQSTVMINAINKIESLNISVGEKEMTIRGGYIDSYIQGTIQNAPKGTKVFINYYTYSGTGGHEHEKVNLNLFYIKKEDPK